MALLHEPTWVHESAPTIGSDDVRDIRHAQGVRRDKDVGDDRGVRHDQGAGGACLHAFVAAVFDHLPRADQRRWAELHVRALLRTPGKKSLRRLAMSVSDSPTASQALHQFLNASPWDWTTARRNLLHQLAPAGTEVTAWTLAPALIPKRGDHSAGVHRRFDPYRGRSVNCQLGLVMLATGEHGPLPVNWGLYVPRTWSPAQRTKARVPDTVRGPLWSQAADVLQRTASQPSGQRAPVTADLSWLPDREAFIDDLARSRQPFVVSVPDTVRVVPVSSPSADPEALTVRRLLAGRGDRPAEDGRHVLNLPVLLPRPSSRRVGLRLLVQHRPNSPAELWLTNLVDRPVPELRPLMRQPRLAASVIAALHENFGLRDFEGRSFPGWHHHTTLVSTAFAYSRLHGDPV
ncbi:IS701 family transposase [Streptomyces longwoodensis]|uniref:IS701 family transposase n=1 Tax=Streptomyces longwoodensis TaxID=68231 RepID=UPI000A9D62A2|nr:transposase [Streptomyces longwoodensis]